MPSSSDRSGCDRPCPTCQGCILSWTPSRLLRSRKSIPDGDVSDPRWPCGPGPSSPMAAMVCRDFPRCSGRRGGGSSPPTRKPRASQPAGSTRSRDATVEMQGPLQVGDFQVDRVDPDLGVDWERCRISCHGASRGSANAPSPRAIAPVVHQPSISTQMMLACAGTPSPNPPWSRGRHPS